MSAGQPAGRGRDSAGTTLLNERYEVLPDQPLPGLDAPSARAFGVRDHQSSASRNLFALVCNAKLPPRLDLAKKVRRIDHQSLMRLLDTGVIDWPPEARRCTVLIYERPKGERMLARHDATAAPMTEDELARLVIKPLSEVLVLLANFQIVHRAIRPDNIFHSDGTVILGDAICGPPAAAQPAVFETVEMGMTDPAARGVGDFADDLYALGATIVALRFGAVPMAGLSDREVAARKLELGSYAALVGEARFSLTVMEPLRGLLQDDPSSRWPSSDLVEWVNGRRRTPRQASIPRRARRPFGFEGRTYNSTRVLANAFAEKPEAAAAVIASGDFERWVMHSVEEGKSANAALEARERASDPNRMIAYLCNALDPTGPIRYRGAAVMPDGLGPALAEALNDETRRKVIAEIIALRLPIHWYSNSEIPDRVRRMQAFDGLAGLIEDRSYVGGVERCVYQLNPSLHCLSPIVQADHVGSLRELLPALERAATRANRAARPMDRHIATFIAARSDSTLTGYLRDLGTDDKAESTLAMLRLLALLQTRTKVGPLPQLANWLGQSLAGVVDKFHNLGLRQILHDRLTAAASNGDLDLLAQVLGDPVLVQQDADGYARARARFARIAAEIVQITQETAARDDIAQVVGQRGAAMLCNGLAGVTGIALLLVNAF